MNCSDPFALGCVSPVKTRGMCNRCYLKARAAGTIECKKPKSRMTPTESQREDGFWGIFPRVRLRLTPEDVFGQAPTDFGG
jgi:hypothetical protein